MNLEQVIKAFVRTYEGFEPWCAYQYEHGNWGSCLVPSRSGKRIVQGKTDLLDFRGGAHKIKRAFIVTKKTPLLRGWRDVGWEVKRGPKRSVHIRIYSTCGGPLLDIEAKLLPDDKQEKEELNILATRFCDELERA